MIKELLAKINKIETMISVYSDRDYKRVFDLQCELNTLNLDLLDLMNEDNMRWLKEQSIKYEA